MILNTRSTRRVLLVLCTLLLAVFAADAQNGTVNFSATQLPAGRMMKEIEEQTRYRFGFEKALFDTSRQIRLGRTALTLTEALDKLTETGDIAYLVRGSVIVLSPKPASMAKTKFIPPKVDVYLPNERRETAEETRPVVAAKVFPQQEPEIVPPTVPQPSTENPAPYSSYTQSNLYTLIGNDLPGWALKSNLLYGALTLTPNIGVEFALGKRATFEIMAGYNPWNWEGTNNDNKKAIHYYIQPEFRLWTCERFNGHYFGAHAVYVKYNVGQKDVPMLFEKEFQYEGWAAGAGLSYGYHLPLSKRWGADFNIGAGAGYLKYDKYKCGTCGELIGKKEKWYIGPTKIGVSLLYMFK